MRVVKRKEEKEQNKDVNTVLLGEEAVVACVRAAILKKKWLKTLHKHIKLIKTTY